MTRPDPQDTGAADAPRSAADLPPEDRVPPPARRRPAGLIWAVALATVVLVIAVVVALRSEGGSTAAPPEAAGGSAPNPLDRASGDLTGQPLPGVGLETVDGQPTTLAAQLPAGQPAVVNFFASWCVPCVTEMPDFEQAHQQFGDRVAFLGVNVNDSVDNGRNTVTRTGVTYPTVRDPLGDLLTAVGGANMPTTVIVRADGTVAKVRTGQVSRDELERTLRELGA
jgi:thiol-disulfide isomerase/thioredoxin